MNFDNIAEVTVPPTYVGDTELTVEIWQSAVNGDGSARFSYIVREDSIAQLVGSDLSGPASGVWPEAADMAFTLGSFLSATYECGELAEHGESYTPAEQVWLSTVAERFGCWVAERDEPEDEPMSCLNSVDGHWYVVTYGAAPYQRHARDCATCESR